MNDSSVNIWQVSYQAIDMMHIYLRQVVPQIMERNVSTLRNRPLNPHRKEKPELEQPMEWHIPGVALIQNEGYHDKEEISQYLSQDVTNLFKDGITQLWAEILLEREFDRNGLLNTIEREPKLRKQVILMIKNIVEKFSYLSSKAVETKMKERRRFDY